MTGSHERRDTLLAVVAAVFVFSLLLSAMPVQLAYAQAQPLFSATLIAPSGGNFVRRQFAAIIANAMQQVGIDARVIYLTFDDFINRALFLVADPGSTFVEGGYDIGFLGFGYTAPVPDIASLYRTVDFAPAGRNYPLYSNPEVDRLLGEYAQTVNVQRQVELAHQISAIIYNDAPKHIIHETENVWARRPGILEYGQPNVISQFSFPDVQHYSGVTEFNFGEANPVFPSNNLNPLQTAASNSFYALYIYGQLFASQLEVDPRTNAFYPGIAESRTASPDGRSWMIKLREGVKWHSGVEMTADDAMFTRWLLFNPLSGAVGLGDLITYVGSRQSFTFLNGTTVTIDNTVEGAEPTVGSWRAVDRYTYAYSLHAPYAFADLVFNDDWLVPKHILESIPPQELDSHPYSTASEPMTYTWDPAVYGGTGSYTAVGPVGNGAYYLESYDFAKRVATMKRFEDYWNATGLRALGRFTVDTYRAIVVTEKDAALAQLFRGELDQLDYNFQLQADLESLNSNGMQILFDAAPGWQEMGFNMQHPVFGTGEDTPLGRRDPSQAAEAARHIRRAISFLIPRDLIVSQLLNNVGKPGSQAFVSGFGPYFDPSIRPDPYDPAHAREELAAAGYDVGVVPPPLEQEAITDVPLVGTSIVLQGEFANPATGESTPSRGGVFVLIEKSTDQQNWEPISVVTTDPDGSYRAEVVLDTVGTVYYRAHFTGLTAPVFEFVFTPGEYEQLVSEGTLPRVGVEAFSGVLEFEVRRLGDFLTDALGAYATRDQVDAVGQRVETARTSLTQEISALREQVVGLTTGLYIAIALVVILGGIGVVFGMRRRAPAPAPSAGPSG